jgi:hypothetical protein
VCIVRAVVFLCVNAPDRRRLQPGRPRRVARHVCGSIPKRASRAEIGGDWQLLAAVHVGGQRPDAEARAAVWIYLLFIFYMKHMCMAQFILMIFYSMFTDPKARFKQSVSH